MQESEAEPDIQYYRMSLLQFFTDIFSIPININVVIEKIIKYDNKKLPHEILNGCSQRELKLYFHGNEGSLEVRSCVMNGIG